MDTDWNRSIRVHPRSSAFICVHLRFHRPEFRVFALSRFRVLKQSEIRALDERLVMKAAVYEGKGQLVVREVPEPVLESGEVLLAIEACCVCGTDLRTYRHGDAKITPPRILGHEFCGRVVESRADGAAGPAVGDRVVMYIVLPCGQCRYCEIGRENLCEQRTTMAYHHDGAFA